MERIIQLNKSKCTACYSCVRNCPVKAIHVNGDSVYPFIEADQCIICGNCIDTCAYDAIHYSDSKQRVKHLLNSYDKVAAVIDPAIAGEFDDITDYRKFVRMIRLLGFDYVLDMSFGVDIIAEKFKKLTHEDFNGKYYISSCCPSIVHLVEKLYPDLLGNLAPFVSPNIACNIVARKVYGPELKTVHITPCVALKKEVDRTSGVGKVNEVLTFIELRELFEEYNLSETFSEYSDFDEPIGYKGGMYPISQGFLEAANQEISMLNESTMTIDGKSSVHAIKQFLEHYNFIRHHYNIFICKGCIMGPGMSKGGEKYKRFALVKDYMHRRLSGFDLEKWQAQMSKHSNYEEFNTTYTEHRYELPEPDELAIRIALNGITKRHNNKEVNCTGCGFATCRDLAYAIAQNTAIPEMCVTNTQIGNVETFYNSKIITEELEMVKKELHTTRDSLEETKGLLDAKNEALSIFVRGLNTGIVFYDDNLKIVESNLAFIEILGDDVKDIHEVIPYLIGADLKSLLPPGLISQFQYILHHDETHIVRDAEIDGKLVKMTIFQLIPFKLVGAVFRNLHLKEERPEEIIRRVSDVIEENLRQVQQIGFILGEGAAKTEKMLNSIIKTYD